MLIRAMVMLVYIVPELNNKGIPSFFVCHTSINLSTRLVLLSKEYRYSVR